MFDWIIEADIYRLNRELSETRDREHRARLERLIDSKAIQLSRSRGSIRTRDAGVVMKSGAVAANDRSYDKAGRRPIDDFLLSELHP